MPRFPIAADHLWRTFNRLRRRKGGGFGPSPIEWGDIEAFQRLTGLVLEPWEISLLEELDDLYLASG